ncbi:phosphoribosylanthranilate isomerase [Clostridium kluyveri]|uniref:N-(5'-phosphoribosyl)anthranilate isomerase n=1 Tax=Clostridium kluyveri TaxID=1534 RepID=A0A1L5F6L5_CLOKL|nr:phosphoribosylanthranilate isomerase [Clostridium kluyveri]APM38656.1 N-(5'-phosphoribosyl)anthranilate isomerase [Clostridium kluyveri]UZQ50971.1 phosphoribosylanthranilate isomerase [Clostridium kluyveri]
MIKVKICGLKREEDIKCVNKYKPDYVGFVFSKSKRQVNLEQAKMLIANLDSSIKSVGVFVDEALEYVYNTSKILALDVIQFHGSEDEEYMRHFNEFTIWKALKVRCREDILNLNYKYADGIVLDNKTAGSGKCFDWDIARDIKIKKDLILAGGINEENVETAAYIVSPNIVDVSSGVESQGYKDSSKIKMFIEKVRNIK